jgi:menaquinol-cytochrome c reductase iron-sulfur subunit
MHDEMSRRRFLNRLILGLSGLAGAVVSVPIVAYLLSPLIKPSKQVWRDLGEIGNYSIGRTVEVSFEEPSPLAWAGQTAKTAAWLRREDARTFTAFAVNCTHLGCPVNWLPSAELFMCPCHGGVYYGDGTVAGGPPPRPLVRHEVRIVDGHVQILTLPLQVG